MARWLESRDSQVHQQQLRGHPQGKLHFQCGAMDNMYLNKRLLPTDRSNESGQESRGIFAAASTTCFVTPRLTRHPTVLSSLGCSTATATSMRGLVITMAHCATMT